MDPFIHLKFMMSSIVMSFINVVECTTIHIKTFFNNSIKYKK